MRCLGLVPIGLLACATTSVQDEQPQAYAEAHFRKAAESTTSDLPFLDPRFEAAAAEAGEPLTERQIQQLVLGLQLRLKDLGYLARPYNGELDQRTRAAILAYRADADLPATTALFDDALWSRMKKDLDAITAVTYLPHNTGYEERNGMVIATGTWRMANTTNAYPMQTTEFRCFLAVGFCVEATAKLSEGAQASLFLHLDVHLIDEVTAETLRTKPDEAMCAQSSILVNRTQGLVSRTRVTTSTTGACKGMTQDNPHLDLVPGADVSSRLSAAQRDAQARVLGVPRQLLD